MHVSLTPELQNLVKSKFESGLYHNASEVVREALRFMEMNQDLVFQMKLDRRAPTWRPEKRKSREVKGLF